MEFLNKREIVKLVRRNPKGPGSLDESWFARWPVFTSRNRRSFRKRLSVLPLLLEGIPETALPPLLNGCVDSDFREAAVYFTRMFDLILSLYEIEANHPAVADIRTSLRKAEQADERMI
jgi:hypothetical protein